MNLIIDLGNTLSKYAVFNNNQIIFSSILCQSNIITINDLKNINSKFPFAKQLIISSVINLNEGFLEDLNYFFDQVIVLNHQTLLPIQNGYSTKTTLGYDRIATAVGANTMFPNENVLIIDLGTAITFDVIDTSNTFLGGNISPGMNTRFKALNTFTKKLPLLSAQEEFSLIGNTTIEAIINGVQNGIIFEIEGYIAQLNNIYPSLKVILTGGDTFFFAKKLKNIIFAEPNLLFIGLNRILNHNVEI